MVRPNATINGDDYSETLLLFHLLRRTYATFSFVKDESLANTDPRAMLEEAVCVGDETELLRRIQSLADKCFDYRPDGDKDAYRSTCMPTRIMFIFEDTPALKSPRGCPFRSQSISISF